MAEKARRYNNLSPYNETLSREQDEMNFGFMQKKYEARLGAENAKFRLFEKISKLEKTVTSLSERLDDQEVFNDAVAEKVIKLEDEHMKHKSAIKKSLEMLHSNSERNALVRQDFEQFLAGMEKAVVGSRSRSSARTETGVARGDKQACPFCGKLLSVNYVKRHQKKWCKKTTAAAPAVAEQEEAPKPPCVISHVRSLGSD